MKDFDEEEKEDEQLDELSEEFDEDLAEPPADDRRPTSRAVSWVKRMWSSLEIEERRVSLADLLKLFLCLLLATALLTVAMALIRFSLTREGAIFWLLVSIIVVITMRHKIFRH